ncbi:uncharacterized protein LOC122508757 [Leptopilina heterotoma]|uniref:uncharacterized protein LOC122508757 n=1 Tax=Leptopilina heterotoma TaxID=63436 RepID=UPI001CA83EBB|nr:uncharacterized protein LOC122508757 [Leptopilina heterotoma]
MNVILLSMLIYICVCVWIITSRENIYFISYSPRNSGEFAKFQHRMIPSQEGDCHFADESGKIQGLSPEFRCDALYESVIKELNCAKRAKSKQWPLIQGVGLESLSGRRRERERERRTSLMQ